ncbi:hypothetical protein SAY87_012380 [Trapa incisa]|uniref:Uncharacterized protein n=1 Tax=Trapa incisa TaxID=236973 RepID=A0AAN7GJZ0_9MYRT|nr:hypothetical protein SAY87_012380 [Trapa incisa]
MMEHVLMSTGCLRNRHEWAQLVDCGPKTNSSRNQRTESQDLEDEEDSKPGSSRDVESKSLRSQREDFPRGKRKVRRGIKDFKRRSMTHTDDEGVSFSSSTEDGLFTEEDETEGEEEASSDSENIGDSWI